MPRSVLTVRRYDELAVNAPCVRGDNNIASRPDGPHPEAALEVLLMWASGMS
jgi:hypothetical protein